MSNARQEELYIRFARRTYDLWSVQGCDPDKGVRPTHAPLWGNPTINK
jgi:hypothetical protein